MITRGKDHVATPDLMFGVCLCTLRILWYCTYGHFLIFFFLGGGGGGCYFIFGEPFRLAVIAKTGPTIGPLSACDSLAVPTIVIPSGDML